MNIQHFHISSRSKNVHSKFLCNISVSGSCPEEPGKAMSPIALPWILALNDLQNQTQLIFKFSPLTW